MSFYKIGDTAYLNSNKVTIAKVIDNPMLPVYQYQFEPPFNNIACAINSLSDTPGGPCHRMWEDEKDEEFNEVDARVNTVAMTTNTLIEESALGVSVFFKPDFTFVKWLAEYAEDRMIIDVGSGQGHLLRMLKRVGAKVMGLEPDFDYVGFMNSQIHRTRGGINPNEVLPWTVQRASKLIQGMGDKVLLVFARPCHSTFVEEGIDNLLPGQEALYITIPENLDRYNDLGKYEEEAVLLDHQGTSEDEEVVYSVTKA